MSDQHIDDVDLDSDDDLDLDMVGDDVCDMCISAGVHAVRVTYCGKTIGMECGCDERYSDGCCGNDSCIDCYPES